VGPRHAYLWAGQAYQPCNQSDEPGRLVRRTTFTVHTPAAKVKRACVACSASPFGDPWAALASIRCSAGAHPLKNIPSTNSPLNRSQNWSVQFLQ
jgi:hypothetical protein